MENSENPMVDLGWKSVGVLELTALPSINKDHWVPLVRETDSCWWRVEMPSICATGCDSPEYAIDDQTAIKVIDGAVEVVSEGN